MQRKLFVELCDPWKMRLRNLRSLLLLKDGGDEILIPKSWLQSTERGFPSCLAIGRKVQFPRGVVTGLLKWWKPQVASGFAGPQSCCGLSGQALLMWLITNDGVKYSQQYEVSVLWLTPYHARVKAYTNLFFFFSFSRPMWCLNTILMKLRLC